VPADQVRFWTKHWQQREREVDNHIAHGDVLTHDSTEEFLSFSMSTTPPSPSREVRDDTGLR